MRGLTILGLAFGLLASSPSYAVKLDLRQIKCEEFLKQDKDFHGQILMWFTGYTTSEDVDPVIDFDDVIDKGKKLGAFCAQNPGSTLLNAYETATK